ncbi:MAG TPA: adenylosuccinate lyase [Kiritimatiellia bacterium]|nr:adenylosuccinate lyase [Kiritimatiellia bacterium]HPA77942.1 adenylosuccinate lyase [Kiritimatiellia bacterium]HQQ04032.1 adenylosuccinate lyase [Kiritimatiellia bacterium]
MIERYYPAGMKEIWDEAAYYGFWKSVWQAVLRTRGQDELAAKLAGASLEPEAVRAREAINGHELNACLALLEEQLGGGAVQLMHRGLTSSDVMDTARMLQLNRSLTLIQKTLDPVLSALKDKAVKYKHLIICGRTHGQWAEPTTLGLKFARFLSSGQRAAARLENVSAKIAVGKITGAVGTYSLISPDEEARVLARLGLKPLPVTSQIIPRDLFSDYLYALAMVCAFAEEIALGIRLMGQDGIREAAEPFASRQTGSSAMPHKKNPVICERICGLARLVRSHVEVGIGNIALWNERDISHSSNERIILEESSSLTLYILEKLLPVVQRLEVYEDNIRNNLERAGVRIFSSGILKALLETEMSRDEAYAVTKQIFQSGDDPAAVRKLLGEKTSLSAEAVSRALDPKEYVKHVDDIFKRMGL